MDPKSVQPFYFSHRRSDRRAANRRQDTRRGSRLTGRGASAFDPLDSNVILAPLGPRSLPPGCGGLLSRPGAAGFCGRDDGNLTGQQTLRPQLSEIE